MAIIPNVHIYLSGRQDTESHVFFAILLHEWQWDIYWYFLKIITFYNKFEFLMLISAF